jgi:hypothetical protein
MPQNANPKKLFIPRKNTKPKDKDLNQNDADINWRAIENWANDLNPILQLIAGSGITLNPTDGLGPTVTISSTGGGGTPSSVTLQASCDSNDIPATMLPLGPSDFTNPGNSYWPIWTNTSGGTAHFSIGAGWMTDVNAGDSVNIFPYVAIPPFTGGPIGVQIIFWAAAFDLSNYINYSGFHSFVAPTTYQFVAGDFVFQAGGGADLSLVAGAGTSGVGLVSAAGSIVYWAGVGGVVSVPTGTTFP